MAAAVASGITTTAGEEDAPLTSPPEGGGGGGGGGGGELMLFEEKLIGLDNGDWGWQCSAGDSVWGSWGEATETSGMRSSWGDAQALSSCSLSASRCSWERAGEDSEADARVVDSPAGVRVTVHEGPGDAPRLQAQGLAERSVIQLWEWFLGNWNSLLENLRPESLLNRCTCCIFLSGMVGIRGPSGLLSSTAGAHSWAPVSASVLLMSVFQFFLFFFFFFFFLSSFKKI